MITELTEIASPGEKNEEPHSNACGFKMGKPKCPNLSEMSAIFSPEFEYAIESCRSKLRVSVTFRLYLPFKVIIFGYFYPHSKLMNPSSFLKTTTL